MRRRRWLQRHQWRRRCGCEVGGRDRHAAAALSHLSSRSRAERNEEGRGVLPDVYRPGAIPLGNWAYPGPKPPRTRASKGACWARGIPARKWASKLNRMEGGIPYIEQKGRCVLAITKNFLVLAIELVTGSPPITKRTDF